MSNNPFTNPSGNKRCQAQKGIFVISKCKNPSTHTCDECHKQYCQDHMHPDEPICLPCASSLGYDSGNKVTKSGGGRSRAKSSRFKSSRGNMYDDHYMGYWYYNYRHDFFRRNNVKHFDEQNHEDFNERLEDINDNSMDGNDSLFDS